VSMPFYVAPEQALKDKADYARKGIARGRALCGLVYADGVAIVAENPSRTLHKVSEVYDRIGFAGVGKYSEFDQLRVAGIRAADLKGYQYSRDDVDARSLANQYAQILGQVFTHEFKPFEVEILLAEVGFEPGGDQLFHVLYDGTVRDEVGYSALGGDSEVVGERLGASYRSGLALDEAIRVAVAALSGPDRTLSAGELEVAVLERGQVRRCFRRIEGAELGAVIGSNGVDAPGGDPGAAPPAPGGAGTTP
jgi:proteasome alpha subunit